MEAPIKSHDTIVIGWNSNQEIVYIRTFDYEGDKLQAADAQAAFQWCTENCACWEMGTTEHFERKMKTLIEEPED